MTLPFPLKHEAARVRVRAAKDSFGRAAADCLLNRDGAAVRADMALRELVSARESLAELDQQAADDADDSGQWR